MYINHIHLNIETNIINVEKRYINRRTENGRIYGRTEANPLLR